jgi:glycoside/pentoside/hexuronide:cation symporter, GPH family
MIEIKFVTSQKERIGYGVGDLASNLVWTMMLTYLIFFYTDIYGLNAAFVGTMMLAVRVWDAIITPVIGVISDRTTTRWGKFRPYLIFGAIPLALANIAMYTTPDLSHQGKMIYACLMYILVITFYTIVNVPYSALMGVMSNDSVERETISTYRLSFAFTGAIFVQFFTYYLVEQLGNGDDKLGFQLTSIIYSLAMVMMLLFTFVSTKERVREHNIVKSSIKQDFKDLINNKPWLILCAVSFLSMCYYAIRTGATMYYFKYLVEDEKWVTTFLSGASVFLIIGILSTRKLTQRFNKVKLFSTLLFIDSLMMSLLFFVDPKNIVLIHVVQYLAHLFIGPTTVLIWSMYSDSAVYSEWKTGRRATALVFSASVFTQKLGVAVGAAAVGWCLGYVGFVANAPQDEQTLFGIMILMTFVPGSLSLIGAFLILSYRLDGKTMRLIEEDLQNSSIQSPQLAQA